MIPRELFGRAMAQQWGVNPDLPFTNPGLASNQLIGNLRNEAKINKTQKATKNQTLANYIFNGAPRRPRNGSAQNNTLRGNTQRLN